MALHRFRPDIEIDGPRRLNLPDRTRDTGLAGYSSGRG
jgi:hypothetical protein